MSRLALSAAASLAIMATSANAAPGFGGVSLMAGGDSSARADRGEARSMLDRIAGFLNLNVAVKPISEPISDHTPVAGGLVEDCSGDKTIAASDAKDALTLAKKNGPEPVYLAF